MINAAGLLNAPQLILYSTVLSSNIPIAQLQMLLQERLRHRDELLNAITHQQETERTHSDDDRSCKPRKVHKCPLCHKHFQTPSKVWCS